MSKKEEHDVLELQDSSPDSEKIQSIELSEETISVKKITPLSDWPEKAGIMKYLLPLQWFFGFLCGICWKGLKKKTLRMDDIPKLDPTYQSGFYQARFTRYWEKYKNLKRVRLLFTLYSCFWFEFCVAGFIKLFIVLVNTVYPICFERLLISFQPLITPTENQQIMGYRTILPKEMYPPTDIYVLGYRANDYMCWVWLSLITILQLLNGLSNQYSYYLTTRVGTKMRMLLNKNVYSKIFRLKNAARKRHSNGEIMNYLANDSYLVDIAQLFAHDQWSGMISIAQASFFVIRLFGYTSIPSFVYFFIAIILMYVMNILIYFIRLKYFKYIDERIKVIKESVGNLLLVKYFNLQKKFLEKIMVLRNEEMKNLRIVLFFQSVSNALAYSTPPILVVLSLATYYGVYEKVNVIAFLAASTYYTLFRNNLATTSYHSITYFNGLSSMKRLQAFLEEEEEIIKEFEPPKNNKNSIEIFQGNFSYDSSSTTTTTKTVNNNGGFTLRNINVEIERGSLVMIVGETRSGKTSFLKSLLRQDMNNFDNIKMNGEISYVAQDPWILNDTIRNNITIGYEYNKAEFNDVLTVCHLLHDLQFFEGGVDLEIGESGKTISGGQKSRISLCRAIYCKNKKDIFLFDNILSSLDSFVSNFIFSYCITRYLMGKTRIMVTNKLQFLPYCDKIIFFKDGEIVCQGKYNDLIEENLEFKQFCGDEVHEKDENYHRRYNLAKLLQGEHKKKRREEEEEEEEEEHKIVIAEEKQQQQNQIKVTKDEERFVGTIKSSTFKSFLRTLGESCWGWKSILGGLLVILMIFLLYMFIMGQFFVSEFHIGNLAILDIYHLKEGSIYNTSFTNVTILETGQQNLTYCDYENGLCPENSSVSFLPIDVFWDKSFSNGTIIQDGITPGLSIGIYGILCFTITIGAVIQTFSFFLICNKTINIIFKKALSSIFNSKMSFLYENNIGRVINRLSADITRFDYDWLVKLENNWTMLYVAFGIGGLVIGLTFGIFTPFVILVAVIMIVGFILARKSIVELKRLESITRSQVFHHFTQTLSGVSTIKTMKLEEQFKNKCKMYLNEHNRPFFIYRSMSRMAELYLYFTATGLAFMMSGFCILFAYYIPFSEDLGGSYALANVGVSNILVVIDMVTYCLVQFIEIEIQSISLERLNFYGENIESEETMIVDENGKQIQKPDLKIENGKIEFRNFSLRYKENFPLVLKNINFVIEAGEKIAIVGRTGCGKTTLISSILRIMEGKSPESSIFIDNENIGEKTITSVRENISIIPQTPVLFSGTIRSNLDPMNKYTNEELISVLKTCECERIIGRIEGELDGEISENAKEDFSVGEKRLLCLARALLKKSKIVLLDECTSVDVRIDDKIQQIVTKMKDVTVVSITHRLQNLQYYEKVMVIDDGEIVEFDKVKELMISKRGEEAEKKVSHLRKLIDMLIDKKNVIRVILGNEQDNDEESEDVVVFSRKYKIWENEEEKELELDNTGIKIGNEKLIEFAHVERFSILGKTNHKQEYSIQSDDISMIFEIDLDDIRSFEEDIVVELNTAIK